MPKNIVNSNSFVRTFNVYFIFCASGLAALIYQVIWARWLGLVFGNTTTSISIVLGSFMMGLALGSWWVGKHLHRIKNPMKIYALLELFIGFFAVIFPALTYIIDVIYTDFIPMGTPDPVRLFIMSTLAFLLICTPTTMMGATLPLLTDFFRRSPRHTISWKVGVLYATNTLGASIGCILSGFFLIELVGIRATTLIAAALNFTVAFVGLKFSRSTILTAPVFEHQNQNKQSIDLSGKLALFVLTAGGGIALASEVLWTRALEVLVGNSTYAFSMILVLYLFGIAFGSWLMSFFVNRIRGIVYWMILLQIAMGVWMFISVSLFDLITLHLSQYKNVTVNWFVIFFSYVEAISILLPLSILSGAVFPVATRIIDPASKEAEGGLIAKAFAWNTLGALAGSIVGGFAIAPFFDYFHAIYLLGILYAVVALISLVVIGFRKRKFITEYAVLSVLCIFCLSIIGHGSFLLNKESQFINRVENSNSQYQVVFHEPGLQGITSVLKKRDNDFASRLLINGKGMTVKITDTKMMAHIPMLLHPDPRKTLVICFGMGTTYRSAISYEEEATVVELVEEVYNAFDYFYADAQRVREYEKGNMIINDGRNFLKLSKQQYDVITIDPPPPIDGAGVNNLYSQDFVELAKSRLAPGGIMAHWVPYPGSDAGVDDWETFTMLVYSFARVFPFNYTIPGWRNIGLHIIGATEPLNFTLDEIQNKMNAEPVLNDIQEWDPVAPSYFSQLTPLKFPEVLPLPTTDDRPRLEFNLLRTRHLAKKHPFIFLWR